MLSPLISHTNHIRLVYSLFGTPPAREASVSSFRINAFLLNSHDHYTTQHYEVHCATLPLPRLFLYHVHLNAHSLSHYDTDHATMSDWDSVTRIGQKHTGGGAPRETTIKGKSALNAASRQGLLVGSEKKYATGNAVCSFFSSCAVSMAKLTIPGRPLRW